METHSRPWGGYDIVFNNLHTWTKILHINPGERLSLQFHNFRDELWVPLDSGGNALIGGRAVDLLTDVCYVVPKRTAHRIMNPTDRIVRILEVATGAVDEQDIVRLADKYGRAD